MKDEYSETQAENGLSRQELDERIAVLRRFRALLEQQRQKFRDYLLILEKQHEKIEADDTDSLEAHTELENQIVANISSLQKVIVPMRTLYEKGSPSDAIVRVQMDLDALQKKVLIQNEKNRQLLQARMKDVRTQMSAFAAKNPYRGRRSIYAERSVGNTISIES